MKKLVIALVLVFLAVGISLAENGDSSTYSFPGRSVDKHKEPKDSKGAITKGSDRLLAPQCPYTLVIQKENSISLCEKCHVGTHWKIKEERPDITADYPYNMRVSGNICRFKLHSGIGSPELSKISDMFDYLRWHPEVDTIYIDILSGGGEMFIGWQIVSMIEANKARYKITTSVQGFAASAAFLIFCAGDERLVYPNSILMWHETWTFSMFSFDTVSSAEEKARVMRLFQDNCHNYLVQRGALTKDELNDLIAGEKDLWMTGTEALDRKFATGLIK